MGEDGFWRPSRAMLCLLRQTLGVNLILGSMALCFPSARVPNGLRLCGNVHIGASLHPEPPCAQAELSILEPAEEAGGGWVPPAPFQEVALLCSSPAVVCRTPPGSINEASTPSMLVTWHVSIARVRLCPGGSRNGLRGPSPLRRKDSQSQLLQGPFCGAGSESSDKGIIVQAKVLGCLSPGPCPVQRRGVCLGSCGMDECGGASGRRQGRGHGGPLGLVAAFYRGRLQLFSNKESRSSLLLLGRSGGPR